MAILEILFIISILWLLTMWGWFIALGFQVSLQWGLAIIGFFPISPFVFTYHYRRRVRRSIYYYLASVLFFSAILGYITINTDHFFPKLAQQLATGLPDFSTDEETISNDPATTISTAEVPPTTATINPVTPRIQDQPQPESPPAVALTTVAPTETETKPVVVQSTQSPSKHQRRFTTMNVDSATQYLQKQIRVTTENSIVYEGRLLKAQDGILTIRIRRDGGNMVMPFEYDKIQQFEVFL